MFLEAPKGILKKEKKVNEKGCGRNKRERRSGSIICRVYGK